MDWVICVVGCDNIVRSAYVFLVSEDLDDDNPTEKLKEFLGSMAVNTKDVRIMYANTFYLYLNSNRWKLADGVRVQRLTVE